MHMEVHQTPETSHILSDGALTYTAHTFFCLIVCYFSFPLLEQRQTDAEMQHRQEEQRKEAQDRAMPLPDVFPTDSPKNKIEKPDGDFHFPEETPCFVIREVEPPVAKAPGQRERPYRNRPLAQGTLAEGKKNAKGQIGHGFSRACDSDYPLTVGVTQPRKPIHGVTQNGKELLPIGMITINALTGIAANGDRVNCPENVIRNGLDIIATDHNNGMIAEPAPLCLKHSPLSPFPRGNPEREAEFKNRW